MSRHFCCLKRATLNPQRVMWPARIAIQMYPGSRPRVAWKIVQSPSGTTTCDRMEM